MTDFFDWLTATDAGVAADRLAATFRLSPEEMRQTTDALVPAFMIGIQRAMADPAAWARLTQRFGDATANRAPSGSAIPSKQAGEAVIRGLFGTELVHAIARQASLLTGQAPDVVEKMMPALGALTLQSMLQTMAAISAASPKAYLSDAAGSALAEAMRRSANAVEAFSRPSNAGPAGRPSALPMAAVFADALKGSLPWMTPPASQTSDPLALFSTMMTALSSGAPAAMPGARRETTNPPERPAGPAGDPLAGMMTNAQSLQADYVREMLSLFGRHPSL